VRTPVAVAGRMSTAQRSMRRRLAARDTPWGRFRRNRFAVAGSILVAGLTVTALLGPLVAPYDPIAQDGAQRLAGPSAQHLMGTDSLGRDTLSRLLYGAWPSLLEGLSAMGVAFVIGVPLGLAAAYFNLANIVILRISEIMLALPSILLAIGLVAVLGPGLGSLLIAVGVSGVPGTTILTRTVAIGVQKEDFVLGARAIGASDVRIIVSHILPNCLGPLVVSSTFRTAAGMLTASSLSFLGLGVQPPDPEWGAMLSNGRNYLFQAPFITLFPGLAIALSVLGFNLLGDGLRDLLDPRHQSGR
jgi:peptide/nickel transport system permease protein